MFCHYCGLLGHDLKHCASHFALTKNSKEAPWKYGKWLKASGGRQWAGRGKNLRSDTVVDEGSWNSASQGVAAEEDNNHKNPSEHEESGKGKSGNIGMVPDSVINVPEASVCFDTIME